MKSALDKTCPGSRIEYHHDSSNCIRCLRTKYFYDEFQPALEKLKRVTDDVKVCGIITFLNACLQYDSIAAGEKTDPLPDRLSKQTFTNSILPDGHKSIDYSHLLDNILYEKKDLQLDSSFSSRVYALNYKYEKCPKKCGFVTKKSDKKIELKDIIRNPSSQKSKIAKTKLKKEVSDKIPTKGSLKRKRWYFEKLSKESEEYEDDIFEELPFYRLTDIDEMSSSSSDYSNVGTPTWSFSLSPRGRSPTPEYEEDCYSVTELRISRKEAEEYQHRRKKRRSKCSKKKNLRCESPPHDVKAEDREAKMCQPSCSYTIENPFKDEDYDSDEVADDYYTDSEEERKLNGKFC